ncbi:hypothetical protein [Streptomyces sp. NPDC057694]|uniref:hypothetical protein n=1 Tax=Streptomyces sp. NPDC057694 TaxID=3346216 RepID=UPI0036952B4D
MHHPERPATAVEIHQPIPITPTHHTAPLAPLAPTAAAPVQSVVLPDGRVVTGYTLTPAPAPLPLPAAPAARPISRTAVNIALTGVGFAGACGGLALAATFIAALAALVHQIIILAAVIFGGYVAALVFGPRGGGGSTVVNIGKAVIKRNRFYG